MKDLAAIADKVRIARESGSFVVLEVEEAEALIARAEPKESSAPVAQPFRWIVDVPHLGEVVAPDRETADREARVPGVKVTPVYATPQESSAVPPVAEALARDVAAGYDPERFFWPAGQVMFRAGLLACREYMARFVEAQSPEIAASIRANWWPALGDDPGIPRVNEWSEWYEGEYPDGKVTGPNDPSIEALPYALTFLKQQRPDTSIASTAKSDGERT